MASSVPILQFLQGSWQSGGLATEPPFQGTAHTKKGVKSGLGQIGVMEREEKKGISRYKSRRKKQSQKHQKARYRILKRYIFFKTKNNRGSSVKLENLLKVLEN